MIFENIALINFKKHKHLEVDFMAGTNMITGPNYAGKSSVMEAMMIALLGNSAAPCPVQDLINDEAKDFEIRARFSSGHIVTRSSKNSSLRLGEDEPYARGHSAVNKAVLEILGLSKDVFSKVFSSEQGSPQQLLEMEGAELQRFIETVIGIDELDAVLKQINAGANAAKASVKAIEPLLLAPERHQELLSREGQLVTDLEAAEANATSLTESLVHLQAELKEDTAHLQAVRESNNTLREYIKGKESLTTTLAQLGGFQDYLATVSAADVDAAKANYQAAAEMVRQIRESNRAWELFYDRRTSLNNQLEGMEAVDEEKLAALQGKLTEEDSAIDALTQARSERDTVKKNLDLVYQEMQKIVITSEQPPEVTEQAIHHAMDFRSRCELDLTAAESLLKDAVCPTCKRPHDGSLDLEEIADRARNLKQMFVESANTLANLQAQRSTYLGWKTAKDKLDGLAVTQKNLEDRLSNFDRDLDTRIEDLKSERQDTRASVESLKVAQANYQRVTKQLSELKEPEGDPVQVVPTAEEAAAAEAMQVATETFAKESAHNAQAKKHNDLVTSYQTALNNMVPPENMEMIDESRLVEALNQKNSSLSSTITQLESCNERKLALTKELASIGPALQQQQGHIALVKEWSNSYDNHSFVSDLLSNSRAGFIKNAMATVFSVTTEFCKLSTGGDIEEVFFEEGIKYREQGKVRSWKSGSGAQKSLFGLGMKLGVANLITTPWGCLMLDEASAAMSDEISMQAALAMSTMCDQSISITHRKLDVAGNMVALG